MAADNNRHQFNASEAIAQRLIRRVFLDGEDVTERCAAISIVSDEPSPVVEAEGTVVLFKILREEKNKIILGMEAEKHHGKVRIEFDLGGQYD